MNSDFKNIFLNQQKCIFSISFIIIILFYFQYHSTLNISLTPYQFYEKSKKCTAVKKTIGNRVLQPSKFLSEKTIDEYESMIFSDDFLLNNDQIYGYDFEHTLFKKDQTARNLRNFFLQQNCLLHCPAESKGVNVPSLLFGTGSSTFILHVEDYHLAAINYLHWGDPKVWYVIPETHIKEVHELIKNYMATTISITKNVPISLNTKHALYHQKFYAITIYHSEE